MRTTLSLLLIASLLLSSCNALAPEVTGQSSDGFTFAFLTDIHLQPESHAVEGFQKAIDTINLIGPDFVLTGGDLVMDVLATTHGRADSLYELYKNVSAGFDMPLYNTVGNHEVFGWHSDEAGINEYPEFGKKMFEKHMGERYYSFDHKGWHFIILDAIARGDNGHYIGKVDQEQIAWLKEDLSKVDYETPLAMSVHIPFITSVTQLREGSLAANDKNIVITNSQEVLTLFLKHNLRLVLQGHLHFLEDIYVQNRIHFITAGAVSGRWWNNKPGNLPQEGFLLVHLDGDEVDWEYVDYGWTTSFEK